MKIVVFSDGTGNSSAKAEKTNVWRLFQALDQKRGDVRAKYDDGVGTSANKYLALLGGVVGWGLKRNVLDLYKFVCRNYRADSEIYGFGFSRGAYTIRVLVGLIVKEGLVTIRSEEELDHDVRLLYRRYRSKSFPSHSPIVIGLRWLRDGLLAAKDWLSGSRTYDQLKREMVAQGRKDVRVKFLGLWDTVDAYGIPVLELKRGIDWVLWPMMFGDCILSPKVERACHALSLDDERITFHPLLWDELAEARMVEAGEVKAGRITQVWFAGVHSNVGGGYPEDQLSLVTLAWMMNQAIANDLPLDEECVKRVNAQKSPYARRYDSRAGLQSYYRYAPREVPCLEYEGKDIRPIVHGSVIMRMVHGSDRYAPITLPRQFWVLASDGALLPMAGFAQALTLDATKTRLAAAASAIKTPAVLAQERSDLEQAINTLARPDADAAGVVWDTVWWRRFVYFLTLVLTALLVAYPFTKNLFGSAILGLLSIIPGVGGDLAAWLGEVLDRGNGTASGLITPVVDAVAAFIPSDLASWTEALEDHPIEFGSLVLGIAWCLYIGRTLEIQVADRARLAWRERPLLDYWAWLLDNYKGWRNLMLAGLVLFLALFIAAPNLLAKIETGVVAAFLFVLWLWRVMQVKKSSSWSTSPPSPKELGKSPALIAARRIRTNRVLAGLFDLVFKKALPIAFALGLLAAGVFVLNRALFDAVRATGAYCDASTEPGAKEKLGHAEGFRTDQICWHSGLVLEAGRRYRITLNTPGDWFDRTIRTDVGGFSTDSFTHFVAAPLRPWWRQNWFKPIARIGNIGNDEYALDSVERLDDDYSYCTRPERYGGGDSAQATANPGQRRGVQTEEDRQLAACAPCVRKKAETQSDAADAKIKPSSEEEMRKCSPTPQERLKLVAEISPRTTGELFLYVNDAVWMIPGYVQIFYHNNSGTGSIEVERIHNAE